MAQLAPLELPDGSPILFGTWWDRLNGQTPACKFLFNYFVIKSPLQIAFYQLLPCVLSFVLSLCVPPALEGKMPLGCHESINRYSAASNLS